MSRPLLEVADLIRSAGTAFIERNRKWIRWTHIKVLLAIARCRTATLGGHIDECTRCGHRATISYHSCRNRHCPKSSRGHLQPSTGLVGRRPSYLSVARLGSPQPTETDDPIAG